MKKQELVTFKVDEDLAETLRSIPNRSEFIRKAVLNAIDNTCPLCHGAGTLSASQKKHWDQFILHHSVEICSQCHESYLVCDNDPSSNHEDHANHEDHQHTDDQHTAGHTAVRSEEAEIQTISLQTSPSGDPKGE
ncbi:MAG: ribbon-helix-helix domain-containing protein [Spirochaetales bacterium]|nr:ribbon-helix-helix domain-containing protein [Spirochaetales bacterium]